MSNLHILSQNLKYYLETVYSGNKNNEPINDTSSICILPGFILRTNLKMDLSTKIPNLSSELDLLTLDQFLHKVMSVYRSQPFYVLGEDFQLEIISDLFTDIIDGRVFVSDSFQSLLSKLDLDNDDILTVFIEEYNEYLRSCDCSRLYSQLLAVTSFIPSSYWQERSSTILEIFKELDDLITRHLSSLSVKRYFSITSLTGDVATLFSSEGQKLWDRVFPNAKNIFIDAFTVYDSIFLRLIKTLVENLADVNLFIFGPEGILDRLKLIFDSLHLDYNTNFHTSLRAFNHSDSSFEDKHSLPSPLNGYGAHSPDYFFHSAPDMNREVKKLSLIIRALIFTKNVDPSRIIVAARTISKYKSSIENIFGAYGIPFSIEARNPLAYTPSYRFIKATADLLAKIEQKEPLHYEDLIDPLRLGLCLPSSCTSYFNAFPVSDRAFLYLEEKLSRMEEYVNAPSDLDLSFWKHQAQRYNNFSFNVLGDYLNWLEGVAFSSDRSPDFYVSFLRKLLTDNIRHTRKTPIRSISGPAIQNERFKHFKLHPTRKANIVLQNVSKIKHFLSYLQNKQKAPLSWEDISRVIGEVVGGESFGTHHTDRNSILFVEAANIFYREYDYLFLLGVQNDEFPRKFPDTFFLNTYLRKEVNIYDPSFRQADPHNPFLFLVNPENDYIAEKAFFATAVNSATTEVHFFRTYLNTEGRRIEWSCFIDEYLSDPSQDNIISPSSEFLYLEDGTPLENVLPYLSKKEILQVYNWAKHRPNSNLPPEVTEEQFKLIAQYAEDYIQTTEVEDRMERFHTHINSIIACPNAHYLTEPLLTKIIASPYRVHELALIRNCPLQYYFYNFYFNWHDEDKITRDLPSFVNYKTPHYRFGIVPDIVRKRFRVKKMVKDYHKIIRDLFDRQADSYKLTYNYVRSALNNSFYLNFYWRSLSHELNKIASEQQEGINRTWTVQDQSKILLSETSSIEAYLPEHRKDIVSLDKSDESFNYVLPVFMPAVSRKLSSLIRLYSHKDKKPFFDIRLLLATLKYDLKSLLGIEYIEPFQGTTHGIYFESAHQALNGLFSTYPEEVWNDPRPARARKSKDERDPFILDDSLYQQFQSLVKEQLEQLVEKISTQIKAGVFTIEQLDADKCKNCVYRRLCLPYDYQVEVQRR